VAVGGDWMLGYRLFQPLMVLSASLVPFAGRFPAAAFPSKRAALAALVAFFCPLRSLPASAIPTSPSRPPYPRLRGRPDRPVDAGEPAE
jgi:hypothetical protein